MVPALRLAPTALLVLCAPLALQGQVPLRFVDLAHQSHRQVVVDRQRGQYLGHPTTVLLEDGETIIAVYPMVHGRGAIVMKRSSDGTFVLTSYGHWSEGEEPYIVSVRLNLGEFDR